MKKIIFIAGTIAIACCLNACKTSQHTAQEAGTSTTNPVPTKADTEPTGKYWKLVELNGIAVEASKNAKEPHILLHPDGNRLSGNAGCNNIAGSFQMKEAGKITFSQVVSTKMMCIAMETESGFLKIFDKVAGYTVKDDTLVLTDANATPLARFVAVWLN